MQIDKSRVVSVAREVARSPAFIRVALATLALASVDAFAVDVSPVDGFTDSLLASVLTAITTIVAKISPLFALTFGVAFAIKWVKKGTA